MAQRFIRADHTVNKWESWDSNLGSPAPGHVGPNDSARLSAFNGYMSL